MNAPLAELARAIPSGAGFSLRRVYAMVLRYLYLLRGSWPRVIELVYWPTVQMILWGLISQFLRTNSSWIAQAGGVLIAGVLLWDVLFRAQLGVAVSFLEEVWARNLGQLFVTPLRPYELMTALATMSLIRTLIGIVPAALFAIPLYAFSIFDMGLPLVSFFFILMMFGWALPSAYVFEGMRSVMFQHVFRADLFWSALGLDLLYLAIGGAVFLIFFRIVRRRGLLLQMGE